MDSFLLALDFGGTKHAAALLRPGEVSWVEKRQIRSPRSDASADMAVMLELAGELLSLNPGRLVAVGVSFGGPVDVDKGIVRLSHHIPGWENWPLRDDLLAELGAPVVVDNDANVGALGEWRFGAGQDCDSLLYMTVSTGIGGGWVLNGRPYRGVDNMAGEIGHTLVDPSGPLCVCGRYGCLEALASGLAIRDRALDRLEREPESGMILRRLGGEDLTTLTAETVSRAAHQGDGLALSVLLEAGEALGKGIGNALSLMNPQRVVLGGGVTQAGDAYWDAVRRAARRNTLPEIRSEIVPAALGSDSPLWGGIALVEALAGPFDNEIDRPG